jgi:hypothetical protein
MALILRKLTSKKMAEDIDNNEEINDMGYLS